MKERGLVKWFNAAKGYGFIQRETGEDVFVHFTAIEMSGYRSLDEGAEVEYLLYQGPKGLLAQDVIHCPANPLRFLLVKVVAMDIQHGVDVAISTRQRGNLVGNELAATIKTREAQARVRVSWVDEITRIHEPNLIPRFGRTMINQGIGSGREFVSV